MFSHHFPALAPYPCSSTLASSLKLGRPSLWGCSFCLSAALGPPAALPKLSSCVPVALFSPHSFPDSPLLYPAPLCPHRDIIC